MVPVKIHIKIPTTAYYKIRVSTGYKLQQPQTFVRYHCLFLNELNVSGNLELETVAKNVQDCQQIKK